MQTEVLTTEPAPRTFDLLSLSAGAIEGGVEQIIAFILPAAVRHPGVSAWSFERGNAPASVVQLLLDADPAAICDVLETCEDMLAGGLRDEPRLAPPPLVEMPSNPQAPQDVSWGVLHRQVPGSGSDAEQRRFWAVEQASSALAQAVVAGTYEQAWDRKTVAPALFDRLMSSVCGTSGAVPRAHGIMQALLAQNPRAETLTRQFRENAHRLAASGHLVLDGPSGEPLRALDPPIDDLAAAALGFPNISEQPMLAELWRRLAARIGFSTIEAAYLACLASSARAMK